MEKSIENKIMAMARRGAKESEICEAVGFTRSTIRNVLNSRNVKLRQFGTDILKDKIISLYYELGDIGRVAKKLKITYSKAYYYITRYCKEF